MTAIVAPPARGPDWPAILKDALLAGFVTALLSLGLVGVETIDRPQGLDFVTRHWDVIFAALLVFSGRLCMRMTLEGRPLYSLILCGAYAVVAILALVGGNPGDDGIPAFRPFASDIVNWIVALTALCLAIWSAVSLARGAAPVPVQRGRRTLRTDSKVNRFTPWIGGALLIFALVLPWLGFADRQVIDMGILVLTYVMLGWGLNIVVGLAGLLDLGYVAFYAVGAYSFALFAHYYDWDFWTCLPLAGLIAASFGILLGFPVLRLRGDYLAIVTLGFGEIIRIVLINWYSFTRGPDGIREIPRPQVPFIDAKFERTAEPGTVTFHEYFGLEYSTLHRIIFMYYIILFLALIVNFFTLRIRRLPVGRAWEALREDETASRALGINPTNTKLTAFAIGAMFGGIGGAFFATRQGFISPESFTFIESAIILAIVVLGGLGSQVGVVIAAGLLIGVPEVFRELAEFRMIAFGAGMVLIMIWRPRGILSHRDPTVRLHRDRAVKSARPSEGTA
jgi:branched-chain amino acid transport system permease protein